MRLDGLCGLIERNAREPAGAARLVRSRQA